MSLFSGCTNNPKGLQILQRPQKDACPGPGVFLESWGDRKWSKRGCSCQCHPKLLSEIQAGIKYIFARGNSILYRLADIIFSDEKSLVVREMLKLRFVLFPNDNTIYWYNLYFFLSKLRVSEPAHILNYFPVILFIFFLS